jgi:DNA polymerase III epsilon subunit-like protein
MNYIQRWAEAVLQRPDLAVLAIDATSIASNSDVLRLLLMDGTNEPFYHTRVAPSRYPGVANTLYTGIEPAELADAPTLLQVWPDVSRAISGRYVVTYSDFAQDRLDENATQHGLRKVYLVGEDLHSLASEYFDRTSISLMAACARIGHPLPIRPRASERTAGMIALIQAMAHGRTKPLPDADEHPF